VASPTMPPDRLTEIMPIWTVERSFVGSHHTKW